MYLNEIRKSEEGLIFDKILDVKEDLLKRSAEILDIDAVHVVGQVSFDDGLYLLDYRLSYLITLPSSRSMKPVLLELSDDVSEVFVSEEDYESKKDMVDDALALIVKGDKLNLEESVVDNILLSIPLRVLSPDEENGDILPSGNDWSVLTEEQYQAMQQEKQKESNPFSALDGLF